MASALSKSIPLYQRLALHDVIKKTYASAAAFMCVCDKPGDIPKLERHEPHAVNALAALLLFLAARQNHLGGSYFFSATKTTLKYIICIILSGWRPDIADRKRHA